MESFRILDTNHQIFTIENFSESTNCDNRVPQFCPDDCTRSTGEDPIGKKNAPGEGIKTNQAHAELEEGRRGKCILRSVI